MNLRDGGCAFSDSCSYALYRPLANVTDSEDAAAARLQRQLRCLAGQDETFVIQRDAAVEPLGVPDSPVTAVCTRSSTLGVAVILSIR